MQSVSLSNPSSPLAFPRVPNGGSASSPTPQAQSGDRMQLSATVIEGLRDRDRDDCDGGGFTGIGRLARMGAAGYTAYKNLEPAKSAIEGLKGAVTQPSQLPGAALTAGKTFAKASLFSAALVGGLSLVQHGWKVLSGKESLGSAARNVAVDAVGGLGGGFTAAALAGLGTVLLGAVGVTGMGLTIAGVVIGMLGYRPGERVGRSFAKGLVG